MDDATGQVPIATGAPHVVHAEPAAATSAAVAVLPPLPSLQQPLQQQEQRAGPTADCDSGCPGASEDADDGAEEDAMVIVADDPSGGARITPASAGSDRTIDPANGSGNTGADDGSSSEEGDDLVQIRREIDAALAEDEDEEDDGGANSGPNGIRTRNELPPTALPLATRPIIEMAETLKLRSMGAVSGVVETMVVVQSLRGMPALDIDTILWLDGHVVLGYIFDVFGPVIAPLYSVRFNTQSEIDALHVGVGTPVFFAPDSPNVTRYVLPAQLLPHKGSDASWYYDEVRAAAFPVVMVCDRALTRHSLCSRARNPIARHEGAAAGGMRSVARAR